ncbi:MAG: pyridoxamine 5'-phosphate oxidase family protein [Acidimicrobiia bacterium]
MTSCREVEQAAPALTAALEGRFAAHKHALLATLRRDGSPRVSGIETSFRNGELWLAMMPDSRKAADLRRDPRFALHAAPIDLDLVDGDAKLDGRAIEVTDPAELERFVAGHDQAPPPSGVGLFRAELTGASLTRVEGDWLVIDSWREGEGTRQRRRQ